MDVVKEAFAETQTAKKFFPLDTGHSTIQSTWRRRSRGAGAGTFVAGCFTPIKEINNKQEETNYETGLLAFADSSAAPSPLVADCI